MLKKKINENASPEAQYIFSYINRFYSDVEWKGDKIIVPDLNICICPPYAKESLQGGDDKSRSYLSQLISDCLSKVAA